MGWRGPRDHPRDAADALDAVAPGARLVPSGQRSRVRPAMPCRSRPASAGSTTACLAERRHAHPDARHAGPGDVARPAHRRVARLRGPRARTARLLHRDGRPAGRRRARGGRARPRGDAGPDRSPGRRPRRSSALPFPRRSEATARSRSGPSPTSPGPIGRSRRCGSGSHGASSVIAGDDGDARDGARTAGRGSDGHRRLGGRPD